MSIEQAPGYTVDAAYLIRDTHWDAERECDQATSTGYERFRDAPIELLPYLRILAALQKAGWAKSDEAMGKQLAEAWEEGVSDMAIAWENDGVPRNPYRAEVTSDA